MVTAIWNSFRRMPLWVQVWMGFVLGPVNFLTLGFLGAPGGSGIAILAIAGMFPSMVIMLREKGLSKAMAIPHAIIWPFLLLMILILMFGNAELTSGYSVFLSALFVVNAISLAFDIPDSLRWYKGARAIA